MAPSAKPATSTTLGLTGLTTNAMALIAPGAFLWLAYFIQASYGAPLAAQAMWTGVLAAFLLCFATAVAYAELSKLYSGAGSSYFFAEQAFLSKTQAFPFARLVKFLVAWASHLYYWVYPGLMVGMAALVLGYVAGQFLPETFNAAVPSPLLMILFCPLFGFGLAYVCSRGITGATAVNAAINVIQISALIAFSVIAVSYRIKHPQGAPGITLDRTGAAITKVAGPDGTQQDFLVDYSQPIQKGTNPGDSETRFQYHGSAASVVSPHRFSFVVIQASIAVLILVGFESVTWMGEDARDAKRDIPRAVILSLSVQALLCYLVEYFAANYFLHNGYQMSNVLTSAVPVADMMVISGTWLFGSAEAGRAFMLVQAATVFLALVGTGLTSMSIAAKVTYAMGRGSRLPERSGPKRTIWTLAVISVFIGIASIVFLFSGPAALPQDVTNALPHNFWYSFGILGHDSALKIPESLAVVALVSNFGTFLLYMMTCIIAMIAFRKHHTYNGIKHVLIPALGAIANLICISFYFIGPLLVPEMSWKEPFAALAICAMCGVYCWIYFRPQ
jgi:amino acid transporter